MMAKLWTFLIRVPAYLSLCGSLAGFGYWAQAEAKYVRDNEKEVQVSTNDNRGKLTARLIDEKKNAQQKAATVEVVVEGLEIVDPAKGAKGSLAQAHLHYQVDNGVIAATTAQKMSFHNLIPGEHQISVVLADNDHVPLGLPATLMVTIPSPWGPKQGKAER